MFLCFRIIFQGMSTAFRKCMVVSAIDGRSPFSLFKNGQLPFVSFSMNGQMTNFCLHDEQTVNGLRKITWASVLHFPFDVSMSPSDSMSPFLHVSMSPYLHTSPCFHLYLHVPLFISLCLRNSTNRKRDWRRTTASVRLLQTENRNSKLLFVCWKWKRKTKVCFPWLANKNR